MSTPMRAALLVASVFFFRVHGSARALLSVEASPASHTTPIIKPTVQRCTAGRCGMEEDGTADEHRSPVLGIRGCVGLDMTVLFIHLHTHIRTAPSTVWNPHTAAFLCRPSTLGTRSPLGTVPQSCLWRADVSHAPAPPSPLALHPCLRMCLHCWLCCPREQVPRKVARTLPACLHLPTLGDTQYDSVVHAFHVGGVHVTEAEQAADQPSTKVPAHMLT